MEKTCLAGDVHLLPTYIFFYQIIDYFNMLSFTLVDLFFFNFLGLFQTSNFTCAESNANERKQ